MANPTFEIWVKYFNRGGSLVTDETLIQTIPASEEGLLRLGNPIVKNEMGQVEGFDFSIEKGTPFYDAFNQMRTFIRVTYCGTTIFYGRVLTIDNNRFTGTRKVRCEGPLAFLMDSPVEGIEEEKRTNISTEDYLARLIRDHNNYVQTDDPYGNAKAFLVGEAPGGYSSASSEQRVSGETRKHGADSWTDTKSAIEDLRSHYGGYLRARPAGHIGDGIYLDWMNHYFNNTVNSQTVEVGKNILDIGDVTEIDNIFTAIIPIGKHTVTSQNTEDGTSSKDMNLYLDPRIVKVSDICGDPEVGDLNVGYHRYEDYANAVNKYGMIIKPVSFPDADTPEKLKTEAYKWIKNNYQGEVTKFTIKAVDMKQIGENTDPIMVGDRVRIIYPVWVEDNTAENGRVEIKRDTVLTCLSVSYDLYHPENNNYTFGIPANILTKTYGVAKKKKGSSVNQATTATKQTTTSGGSSRKRNWLTLFNNWMQYHRRYYNGLKPWQRAWDSDVSYNALMSGPYLWQIGKSLCIFYRQDPALSTWREDYVQFTKNSITYDDIERYHLIEMVLEKYGVNLYSYWPDATPAKTYTNADGDVTTIIRSYDDVLKIWDYTKTVIKSGVHTGLQAVKPAIEFVGNVPNKLWPEVFGTFKLDTDNIERGLGIIFETDWWKLTKDLDVGGNTDIDGNADIAGDTDIHGTADVDGDISGGSDLSINNSGYFGIKESTYKVKINDEVTYQNKEGDWFNDEGFITCKDIHFPESDDYAEYNGIRSRLAIFDTVIADDVLAKNITAKQVNTDIFKTHDIFSEDIVTDRNIWVDNIFAKSIDMGANGEILSNNYMYAVPGMSKLNILASIYASYRFTEISGGKIQMQGKKFNDQAGDWKDLANFNIAATAKYKTDVAAAHNDGGGTAYCSPGSASIDPGQSHTLNVYYENSNGVPVWTGRSYTVTANDAPAPTHNIDIPNSGIDVYDYEPSGTKLTQLKNAINTARSERKWLRFKVTCGDSKYYKMDFT